MAALDDVLADLDLVDTPASSVSDFSADLLPSTLAVAECAVAAVTASLVAAAELSLARSGHRPKVSLDARHVAAAVRSERWLRDPNGARLADLAPLSKIWPAGDGWVRTHANYPWHRAALLRAFALDISFEDNEPEAALAKAFASQSAHDVEERAYRFGALAVAARTVEQWQASDPGQAVAASPLIAIDEQSTTTRPLPTPGPLPASGIRILDLTRVIAGPTGTRMLGALGAEVLRVDNPNRPELPLHSVDGVIGKTSSLLDLTSTLARKDFEALLAQADVLVTGYRPGALRNFGLDADQLATRHPHLIVAGISAWGNDGLWGQRRGFDSLVQIASGIGLAVSHDQVRPGVLPCQLLDHATGYLLAASVLTALSRRARTGKTAQIRLSLAHTAQWLIDQGPRQPVAPADNDEERANRWRIPLGDGWSGIAPPGYLDDTPLTWPHLPPRYGQASPTWPHTLGI